MIVFVKLQCKKCCKRLLLSRCDENKNLLAVNLHVLITNELHDFRKEKHMQSSDFVTTIAGYFNLSNFASDFGRAIPYSSTSDLSTFCRKDNRWILLAQRTAIGRQSRTRQDLLSKMPRRRLQSHHQRQEWRKRYLQSTRTATR